MAIENIPINSGTGPKVAVDLVGTDNYQVVKIMPFTDGTTGAMWTGAVSLSGTGTVTVASITTGTVSIVGTPAVTAANITVASITTGTLSVINVLSASGITIASITTGTMSIVGTPAVTAANVTVASVATGTFDVANQPMYQVAGTAIGATGTGWVILGVQSGATTSRALAITTTGAQHVNVQNVLSASGITIASLTTGTMNVINVLSASGVTIASVTTGTMNVVNVLSATGVLLAATTANVGAFVATAHASQWNAYVVSTTSGSTVVIVKTSGGHTLYVTDLLVSVDVPMNISIRQSSGTELAIVYLATKGGFTFPLVTPLRLASAQSLVFLPSASGSSMIYAGGYTVT